MWNGVPGVDDHRRAGAAKLRHPPGAVAHVRGVLLDVARARGVDRLDAGRRASPPTTSTPRPSWPGVAVEPGDVVLVRTGQAQLLRERKRTEYADRRPARAHDGLLPGLVQGPRRRRRRHRHPRLRGVPVRGPGGPVPGAPARPRRLGLLQGQNFDLEDLAADCAADGRYTFLLEASPIPFTGAVGAPVNPVAVK